MTEDFIKQVDEWITAHQKSLIKDISRLVQIKSVSGDPSGDKPFGEGPARVLDEALQLGKEMGFDTQNHEYYAGTIKYGQKPDIGILAHLDVVPEGQNWATPPYEVTIKDGYLFGRGVGDDKGPAVAALYAMRFLKEQAIPLKYGIRMVLGCDEETGKGFRDMEHFLEVSEPPLLSLVPDASFPCCNGEKGILTGHLISAPLAGNMVSFSGGQVHNMVPDAAELVLEGINLQQATAAIFGTDLNAELAEGGVKLTATGTACHAAGPFNAISAVERLASGALKTGLVTGGAIEILKFISVIQSDFEGKTVGIDMSDGISTPLTMVIGVACTEKGRIDLSLNLRYPVTATSEPIIEKLSAFAEKYNYTLQDIVDSKPLYYKPEHPAIVTLVNTFNEVTGMQARPKVIGGGTYARAIPRAVSFGAGMPTPPDAVAPFPEGHGGAHQPDEAWSVADMLSCLKIYILTIIKLNELDLETVLK